MPVEITEQNNTVEVSEDVTGNLTITADNSVSTVDIVEDNVTVVQVTGTGPQGPPGPTGPGGSDLTYVHTESSPSATWTITHNLGKMPSVTIVDSADNWVVGEVHYDSNNQVTITFGSAFSGKAYLN